MNKNGMELMTALDGVSDEMLMDALPPGMSVYEKKQKSHRFSGFFERPWVAAVISASVALAVLTGIVWAGRQAIKEPSGLPGEIAGNPSNTENGLFEQESNIHYDTWPDYDNPPVPEDAKVVISSGGYTIAPQEYTIWKQIWNVEKGKMEEKRGDEQWVTYFEEADSGADTSERREILQNLPRIPFQSGDFSAEILHPSLQFYAASAYDENLHHAYSASLDEYFDSAWSIEELLEQLAPGSYCILLIAYDKGTYIEAANDYEDTMYEFLFKVDIFDSGETSHPTEPPTNLPTASEILGVEFWVGDSNPTYERLAPCVTKGHFYDEEQEAWADVGGYAAHYQLGEGLLEVPTLTYASGFKAFFRAASDPAGEGYLMHMTIYNEQLMKLERCYDITDDLYQLSMLKPGTYYVVLEASLKRELNNGGEEAYVEYAFKLVIPNEQSLPQTPPISGESDIWGATVLTGTREIYPVGQNEWTKDALISAYESGLLPEAYIKLCVPQFSEKGCHVVWITLYKVNGETWTKVSSYAAADLDSLQSVEDGDFCVVFDVQCADPDEEASMLLRSYAFMLIVRYESSQGAEGTETHEAETTHPTKYS